jgi:hypothetical protein
MRAHDAMQRTERRSVGRVGKRFKRKRVEQLGRARFIDVESGGWPVHAPCPKQRVAKPGGGRPQY